MTVINRSSVSQQGLVLHVDFANPRGYNGPTIRNVLTGINPRGISDNGTTYRFFSGSHDVYVPTLGEIKNCAYVDMYNDYNGGSGNCCPSPYGYGDGLSVSAGTQYTYAIVYKSLNRYTHPNYMYHYEFNSSGTYLTEYGVHMVGGYSGQETHLGDEWYWSRSVFTTNASAALINTGSWMYQYATWNRYYVAKVALMPGNHLNLHPRYWPALGTTRSATQGILDLTGNHSIDMTNASYNNDGTVNFNGSNSFVSVPNNTILDNQEVTVEVWVKTNATSQNGFWFEKGTVNTQYSLFQEGGSIVWRQAGSSQYTTTATYMNTTNWYQVVGTYVSGSRKTYINGVLVTNDAATGALSVNSGGSSIGVYGGHTGGRGYYYNGNISTVRVYNRVLSAAEILNNFNAQRGRYGV